ncbi:MULTISPECIES: hypothetical protein [unclassified Streptomyces]|uniref:hypothetical protein n=1 Tax=unclassified Streptomyces TaxID=2593676 RepID=UPI002E807FCD|nr:hypothetical protein [Streptomyces sp. NBC_00589]WTI41994.1 hypothetical protein OIC96_47050 [Streptomyces sp. NBC_00775]WUB24323.1 hypothetical protein OHA51_02670 [Streptomyces sp. NBC_00589]
MIKQTLGWNPSEAPGSEVGAVGVFSVEVRRRRQPSGYDSVATNQRDPDAPELDEDDDGAE